MMPRKAATAAGSAPLRGMPGKGRGPLSELKSRVNSSSAKKAPRTRESRPRLASFQFRLSSMPSKAASEEISSGTRINRAGIAQSSPQNAARIRLLCVEFSLLPWLSAQNPTSIRLRDMEKQTEARSWILCRRPEPVRSFSRSRKTIRYRGIMIQTVRNFSIPSPESARLSAPRQ